VIGAKLGTLSEELLHSRIVLLVPVDLGLRHQDRNVLFQTLVKLLERFLDPLVVASQPSILDAFGKLAKSIDVSVGEDLKLSQRLLRGGFRQDESVDIFELLLVGHAISEI